MYKLTCFFYSLLFTLIVLSSPSYSQVNPQEIYKELFHAVQVGEIYKDQKTFVDFEPLYHPDSIVEAYNRQKDYDDFVLEDFVWTQFDINNSDTTLMLRHLNYLWDDLTRMPDQQYEFSSLLALPNPYIVPGGRFREIYYWDSYFTMLGLEVSGKVDMIENMVDNFAYLIDTYGHIPNGNRSYYLSRSQPPFFALMVQLLADAKDDEMILINYVDILEKEYEYWMSGEKVVKMDNDGVLTRYWDESNTPRPESYLHDIETYNMTGRDSSVFRELRSAAESGWDFSTRWFDDGFSLGTIITTHFVPVDLNCLMYNLEQTISKAYLLANNIEEADKYSELAIARKQLINKYLWDNNKGYYFDYNLEKEKTSPQFTLAGLFPLFFKIANDEQAEQVAGIVETDFLKSGGLVTTLIEGSGQQWDYPNAWAPLQWIGYKALKNYTYNLLANEIAIRWTNLNCKVYFETGKMMEKYDVVDIDRPGGGGEYETQDGFGWTNGIFLKMWNELKQND
ncbi:alpha,alpha-trehalase TreF [Bacteroidota bacterium]